MSMDFTRTIVTNTVKVSEVCVEKDQLVSKELAPIKQVGKVALSDEKELISHIIKELLIGKR